MSLALEGRIVCIVEDDDATQQTLKSRLARHAIRTVAARSSRELFGLIDAVYPDCILMDFSFASEDGLFVHEEVMHRYTDPPPVIMLGDQGDETSVLKAFRTGVSDCVVKQTLDSDDLLHSIRAAIVRRDQRNAVMAELEDLRRGTAFDSVNGLCRRDKIEEVLGRLFQGQPGLRRSCAVILVRIQHYDRLREKAGQAAAQRLASAFAWRLRKVLRSTDICGHFDERTFIYAVESGATPANIDTLLARLLAALHFQLQLETLDLSVSPSLGVALGEGLSIDVKALIRGAEEQLNGAAVPVEEDDGSDRDKAGSPRSPDEDRRGSARIPVSEKGKIITAGGRLIVDCMVEDVSDGGARLRLGGNVAIPDEFELQMSDWRAARQVRCVWQHSFEMGVAFSSA